MPIGALILSLLFLATISIVLTTLRVGISPQPSTSKARNALLELAPEQSFETIFELGSGWGGLAFALAKRYPDTPVCAYELSYVPYLYSKLRLKLAPQDNLQFFRKDFLDTDLSKASLLATYLFPGGMEEIAAQIIPKLKQETILLSNTFALPGFEAEKEVTLNDFYRTRIYRYRIA